MITTRPRGGPHTANARPAVALRRAPVLTEPLSLPSSRVRREGELLRADNAAVRQESRLHRHRRRGGRGAGSEKGASPVSRAASPPLLGHVGFSRALYTDAPTSRCCPGRPSPGPLLVGPFPFAHHRSILSNFLLQIPVPVLGCHPWPPWIVSGTPAREPRDAVSGRARGRAGARVCVLFSAPRSDVPGTLPSS